MNKITVIAIAAASFFAGLCIGQVIGNSGGFGCNNGNTFINNYGKNDEYDDSYEDEYEDDDIVEF
ncbi:MAG: hypothetical protein IJZ65_05005 [Ruminiclostridium sp.]|nr:hypothetical protein [Ruminiclostridium sp.]